MLTREHFKKHGEKTALIATNGEKISYNLLGEKIEEFGKHFNNKKNLVFLEANNDEEAIVAYFSCLVFGQPVFLLQPDSKHISSFMEIYKPNIVISSDDTGVVVKNQHSEELDLHDELCILLSTSGSTGAPKAVRLSRSNIQSNTNSIIEYLGITAEDCSITNLPFHYSYGLSVLNTHIAAGGCMVLSESSVTDEEFWSLCGSHSVSNISGVPHTFELIKKAAIDAKIFEQFRFITQAGGKLSEEMVRHFAELGNKHGFLFFVMYGQTEASPRIAYLPPDQTLSNPTCIGIPIPGGRLAILSDEGAEIKEPDVVGNLVYFGPNVMMGYSENLFDLKKPAEHQCLETGDMAAQKQNGLFYITGRKKRFLKIFGLRIGLDEAEQHAIRIMKDAGEIAVTGNDTTLVVATTRSVAPEEIEEFAKICGLPTSSVYWMQMEAIPRLSSGKPDYKIIIENSSQFLKNNNNFQSQEIPDSFLNKEFVVLVWNQMLEVLGVGTQSWGSVEEIFKVNLGMKEVSAQDTFDTLGGDSLTYVQISIAIEQYLGFLPNNWHNISLKEIENLKYI